MEKISSLSALRKVIGRLFDRQLLEGSDSAESKRDLMES